MFASKKLTLVIKIVLVIKMKAPPYEYVWSSPSQNQTPRRLTSVKCAWQSAIRLIRKIQVKSLFCII